MHAQSLATQTPIVMSTVYPISVAALRALIDLSKSKALLFENGNRDALTVLFSECQTDVQYLLLKELITNFNYLTSKDLEAGADKLVNHISSTWKLDGSTTLLVASADDDEPDGSQFFCKSVSTALGRAKLKHSVKSRLGYAFQDATLNEKPFSNIVILDDFIGTGDKLSKTVKRLQKSVAQGTVIYVASLAAMSFGLKKINLETTCEVFSCHVYEKGISDSFQDPTREEYISAMLELERKIIPPMAFPKKENEKCYSFGYGQSEALFYLEGFSVPNNVFPIFWKNRYCKQSAFMPGGSKRQMRRKLDERTTLLTRG